MHHIYASCVQKLLELLNPVPKNKLVAIDSKFGGGSLNLAHTIILMAVAISLLKILDHLWGILNNRIF